MRTHADMLARGHRHVLLQKHTCMHIHQQAPYLDLCIYIYVCTHAHLTRMFVMHFIFFTSPSTFRAMLISLGAENKDKVYFSNVSFCEVGRSEIVFFAAWGREHRGLRRVRSWGLSRRVPAAWLLRRIVSGGIQRRQGIDWKWNEDDERRLKTINRQIEKSKNQS